MAKVAKVKDEYVEVVLEDGTIAEYPIERFNFDPEIGVEVDITMSGEDGLSIDEK